MRKKIGKNIISFIRLKGYTITSLSRLTGISASTLHCIVAGEMSKHEIYHNNMVKITESLNLPLNFFLEPLSMEKERWQISTTKYILTSSSSTRRSELAQTLLDDLDELLIIAAFYIK
ncbi:hypothetical protein AN959_17460 [Psychrobacillus sp. FJAT-21963]|nr:hypothetical protein AN959_17460 [Psychrobacillus sp. FJAT-21963]